MYHLLMPIAWLITFLPLRVLYLLSDLLFPILYHVVRYRRKVVRKNLTNSFPEKDLKEIIIIEKKFYRYFCDIFIETFALIHMSEQEILKRMEFTNLDLIEKQYDAGKSVMLMTAHYCNWEWVTACSLLLPAERPIYGIYKKLTSKKFDKFMLSLRQKNKSKTIETQDFYRTILRMRNNNMLGAFGMISDQSPKAAGIRYWTNFLNQDTAVLVGAEQLAKRFDFPILFMNITRKKRGYYHCQMEMIEENPKDYEEYEITEKFTQILEAKIKDQPEFWLWTHNRWKHKKEG